MKIFSGAIFDENKRLQIVNCRLAMKHNSICYGAIYGLLRSATVFLGKITGFSGYWRAGDSMSQIIK